MSHHIYAGCSCRIEMWKSTPVRPHSNVWTWPLIQPFPYHIVRVSSILKCVPETFRVNRQLFANLIKCLAWYTQWVTTKAGLVWFIRSFSPRRYSHMWYRATQSHMFQQFTFARPPVQDTLQGCTSCMPSDHGKKLSVGKIKMLSTYLQDLRTLSYLHKHDKLSRITQNLGPSQFLRTLLSKLKGRCLLVILQADPFLESVLARSHTFWKLLQIQPTQTGLFRFITWLFLRKRISRQ